MEEAAEEAQVRVGAVKVGVEERVGEERVRMQQRNFSEIVSESAARGTGTREGGEGTHQENIPALQRHSRVVGCRNISTTHTLPELRNNIKN